MYFQRLFKKVFYSALFSAYFSFFWGRKCFCLGELRQHYLSESTPGEVWPLAYCRWNLRTGRKSWSHPWGSQPPICAQTLTRPFTGKINSDGAKHSCGHAGPLGFWTKPVWLLSKKPVLGHTFCGLV